MRLARVLLGSIVVGVLALTFASSASAKPKKPAKSGKTDKAAKPAAADVQLDETTEAAPPAKQAPEKSKPKPKPKPEPEPESSEAQPTESEAKPTESEAKPTESEAHADEPSAAQASDATPRPSPFDLELGLRAVNRNFTYKDTPADLFPNRGYPALVPFHLALGPALFLDGNLYPGAFGTSSAAAHIGVAFGYELNFATKAVFAPGSSFERQLHTRASQFYLGVRGRVPLGAHELGLLAAYGVQKFEVTGDEGAPVTPDVQYKFVRLNLDAKFRFGDVSVGGHLGTRLVSDTGPLRTQWFPNTKTKSFEVGIFLSYRLSPALDLVAAADLLRYGFDFNPIPKQADPWTQPIAGGATDQYLTGSLALRFHVPGS